MSAAVFIFLFRCYCLHTYYFKHSLLQRCCHCGISGYICQIKCLNLVKNTYIYNKKNIDNIKNIDNKKNINNKKNIANKKLSNYTKSSMERNTFNLLRRSSAVCIGIWADPRVFLHCKRFLKSNLNLTFVSDLLGWVYCSFSLYSYYCSTAFPRYKSNILQRVGFSYFSTNLLLTKKRVFLTPLMFELGIFISGWKKVLNSVRGGKSRKAAGVINLNVKKDVADSISFSINPHIVGGVNNRKKIQSENLFHKSMKFGSRNYSGGSNVMNTDKRFGGDSFLERRFYRIYQKLSLLEYEVNIPTSGVMKYFFYKKMLKSENVSSSQFSLKQRVFLTKHYVIMSFFNFFFSGVGGYLSGLHIGDFKLGVNKNTGNVEKENYVGSGISRNMFKGGSWTYFLNLHKYFLWKLRKTRYVHWNLRVYGKLNKYRYDKLIKYEGGEILNKAVFRLVGFFFFFKYCCVFSWKQLYKLFEFEVFLVNGRRVEVNYEIKLGDIVEVPYGASVLYTSKAVANNLRGFSLKMRQKLYNFRYLHNTYLYNDNPITIPDAAKYPMFLQNLPMESLVRGEVVFLVSLGVIAIINPLSIRGGYNIDTYYNAVLSTTVLKLNNWRHNFD